MRTISSFLLSFVLVAFLSTFMSAQVGQRDVIYLKNGSVIKGVVLEQIPDKTIRVQTADGSIFVFQMSDVERIVKESPTAIGTPDVSVAQEEPRASGFLSIIAGGALPVGPFGRKDGDEAGMAGFGFVGGLEYSHISDGGIYFAIGGQFIMNPVDEDALRKSYGLTSDVQMDVKSWTMAVPSVSLGFATTSSGVRVLLAADFGYAICSSPELKISFSGIDVTQNSAKANAPAFGGRFGIETPKKISFMVRYLATKPKYNLSASGGGFSMSGDMEQRTAVVLFVLGIGL